MEQSGLLAFSTGCASAIAIWIFWQLAKNNAVQQRRRQRLRLTPNSIAVA